jgi:hypothetical protein
MGPCRRGVEVMSNVLCMSVGHACNDNDARCAHMLGRTTGGRGPAVEDDFSVSAMALDTLHY